MIPIGPELALATIKAGFEFGAELLKFGQTPEGQKLARKMMDDAVAREAVMARIGYWIADLFAGRLWGEKKQ